ncbi:MAG: restriction endonuclease subunit S [bacterium]
MTISPDALPPGWAVATLPELIGRDGVFSDGDWVESKDQDPEGDVRLIQLADVGEGVFRDRSSRFLTSLKAGELNCTFLRPGDVLVARMPDPLGRACIFPGAPTKSVTAVDVCIVRPGSESVEPRWLMWTINAPQLRQAIAELQSGTTRGRISRKNLGTVALPIPPLAEQRRIVAAIEEQFPRIEAGVEALQRARRNLQRMRAAALQAAVTGRLVPQDPNDEPAQKLLARLGIAPASGPDIPAGWCWLRLGDAATVGSGATPLRSRRDYYEQGIIPWVTSTMLNAEFVDRPSEFITAKALRETSVKLWSPGTLLVAMYGEGQTRGKCSELLIEATTNQACAAIVLEGEASALRPHIKLHFKANYEANRRLASGGVQPNLSLGLIKSQLIALPPLREQQRIVAEVDRQLSIAQALDEALVRTDKKVSGLRQTILLRAFSGRLVPQDPLDEQASTLLSLINGGREGNRLVGQSQRRLRR